MGARADWLQEVGFLEGQDLQWPQGQQHLPEHQDLSKEAWVPIPALFLHHT